ncbi:histidine phosphotransferase family protein, partial [Roseomonas rosulenta]|uniref:histidine phosphotransferase family protein n=1 Tax=Roseomonas rosulenta TaxID=2748667 RepID=UPI0018DF47AC
MPSVPPLSDLRLARLVGLRLCHDISGVAGTVGNALELMDGAGGEAADLAVDAAGVLRRRLLLWRALLGGQGESPLGTVLGLAAGEIAGGRATVDAAALDAGTMLGEDVVPVLLAAVLLGGEALPRGGVVRLVGDPGRELAVLPDGPRAAWPPALLRAVA